MVFRILIFSLLFALCTAAPVQAASSGKATGRVLYRYVDEHGVTVVKDWLPPDVVTRGYTILNTKMQVIEVVEPVKTKEQLAEAKREKARLEQEARARREAAKHDAELLRQFTHVDDLLRARDTQLAAIDVQISIRTGQRSIQTNQLEQMQKHAADFERRNEAVPSNVLHDIQEMQKRITEHTAFIDVQNKEKERVNGLFRTDIIRFKELQAQRMLRTRDDEGRVAGENTSNYACLNPEHCKKIWQLAQIYAREKATRSLDFVTDTLILSGKALSESDIGISFSKVPDKESGGQIVLEVGCHNSDAGEALCKSDRIAAIVNGFPEYVETRLK